MITGTLTVLIWIFVPINEQGDTLSAIIYEIIPGFIVSSAVIVIVSKAFPDKNDDLNQLFGKFKQVYSA